MRERKDQFNIRSADDPPSLLVIVLDTAISSWFNAVGDNSPSGAKGAVDFLTSVSEQLLVFLNTFLLLQESNRTCVILSGSSGSKLVYPPFPDASVLPSSYNGLVEDSSLESAADAGNQAWASQLELNRNALRDAVVSGIKNSVHDQEQTECTGQPSPLDTALASALCVLNRARRIKSSIASRRLGRDKETTEVPESEIQLNGRIFAVVAGPDTPEHYISMMNCMFSAQRMGIPIDSCILGKEDSTFFQQAAHLTNGVCMRPERFSEECSDFLLQYLQTVFLVDRQSRDFLAMPTPEKVDFRASCMKTRKIIEDGYTCSVCLSTFDLSIGKGAAICPVCSARFAVTGRPRRRPPVP